MRRKAILRHAVNLKLVKQKCNVATTKTGQGLIALHFVESLTTKEAFRLENFYSVNVNARKIVNNIFR